jgi:tetratricopeptide (TPR) repeat protein
MPKQRRAAASRTPTRSALSRAPVKKQKSKPVSRSASAVVEQSAPARDLVRKMPEAPPPPPPRKPAFYEALAVYEAGVRALQRHDYLAGAEGFRGVIQRYPDERELVERARLYLQVCERENAKRPAAPQTAAECVYAATLALNDGDQERALSHLGKALEKAPDNDHAHYIMAVALTDRGDSAKALRHLQRAVELNPDNRSTAIQDPDLSPLRNLSAFQEVLGAASVAAANSNSKKRIRPRR